MLCGVVLWSGAAHAAGAAPMLSESRFIVQEKVGFEWIYEVGAEGLAAGDELKIGDPIFHGMRWSKWGDMSPWPENCTAWTGGQQASWGLVSAEARRGDEVLDVAVAVERSNCTADNQRCSADIHRETWTSVYLEADDLLEEGDTVHLLVGDVAGCEARCEAAGEADCTYCADCGFEMPDRAFPEIALESQECLGEADCEPLDEVILEVSSETAVAQLLVTAPSQVGVGADFALKAALLDQWGNAVASAERTLTVSLEGAGGVGDGETWTLSATDGGWHDFTVSIDAPGVVRLQVSDDGELSALSNPIEVQASPPEYQLFWGDIHVHHGHTYIDSDGFAVDLNHSYARDVVGLDVVAESMKAAGIELQEAELWTELQDNCASYTVDGDYLVLLAFEWIGQIAADEAGTETEGHHNVYYDACTGPLGTHSTEVIDSVAGDNGLWPWVEAAQEATGIQAISVPHATRFSGHNFEVDHPRLQRLAEVYSEWGDSASLTAEADGSVEQLLDAGIHTGFIAASDNHDGWMGNPLSSKSVQSGLGGYWASGLTRGAVFAAMRARRTVATTGHRPIVVFEAIDTDGDQVIAVSPGGEYLGLTPSFSWRVHGTAPVSQITLYSVAVGEGAGVETVVIETPMALDPAPATVDAAWNGETTTAYWLEVRQSDQERAWSSPIWVTADCERIPEGALDPFGRCSDDPSDTADTGDTDEPPGDDTGAAPVDDDDDTGTAGTDGGGVRCSCRGPAGNAATAGGLVFLALFGWARRRS